MLPGAAGLVFRRLFWPSLFGQSGPGTVWGRQTVVRHPAKMWVGSGVLVDDDCFFDAKGCDVGDFRIDDGAMISRGCLIAGKGGGVHIGPRVNIGVGCMVLSDGWIEIGADTMLAGNCYVGGGTYDADAPLDRPISQRPLPTRAVRIGEDCWLGAGVVVIEGVKIGRGSVIGAGSVVTRDIPPYCIAVGAPATVRRRRRHAPSDP
jgi:acetyltransferase-like isoleucine patch superfamily enzyme